MIRLCLTSLLVCLVIAAYAQVEVLAALDQDSIVIGDEVGLSLTIDIDESAEIVGVYGFFMDSVYSALQTIKGVDETTGDTIPRIADFEIINNSGWVDEDGDGFFSNEELKWKTKEVGGKTLLEQSFRFKLWDPGPNIFMTPAVAYLRDGVPDVYTKEQQMTVYVIPPEGTASAVDSLQKAPIKTIIEEPKKLSDYKWYFVIIGSVVLLGFLYWLVNRYNLNKKQHQTATVEYVPPPPPPHILAIEKLNRLAEEKPWLKGEIKKYQSDLTYIIREYLEGRYSVSALESTTNEIITDLSAKLGNTAYETSLQRILQVADLVKFAKAQPGADIHESFLTDAFSFVHGTSADGDASYLKEEEE